MYTLSIELWADLSEAAGAVWHFAYGSSHEKLYTRQISGQVFFCPVILKVWVWGFSRKLKVTLKSVFE
mgnify:CR=1 FL=1